MVYLSCCNFCLNPTIGTYEGELCVVVWRSDQPQLSPFWASDRVVWIIRVDPWFVGDPLGDPPSFGIHLVIIWERCVWGGFLFFGGVININPLHFGPAIGSCGDMWILRVDPSFFGDPLGDPPLFILGERSCGSFVWILRLSDDRWG